MDQVIVAQERAIIDMYALSPMQAGLLFHTLLEEDSPYYVVQIKIALRGTVDPALMEQANRQLIENYDALRTAIVHENVKQPVQLVLRQREGRFAFHDLRALDAQRHERRFEQFLAADRQDRFALDKDVLFRAALFSSATTAIAWCSRSITSSSTAGASTC